MEFLLWDTNNLIIDFLTKNAVLISFIIAVVAYVSSKTPWSWDDDLAPFLKGITNRKPKSNG